jgi:hypothetical protein
MTDLVASVAGRPCQQFQFDEPESGAWTVHALLAESAELSGRVTVTLGSATLTGTVDPEASGDWSAARWVRVVGGGNGWSRTVAARAYHNDLGVKALSVAQDLARTVGETLGSFQPAVERVGVDWALHEPSSASDVLELVAGGVPWWVDRGGVTQVKTRPTSQPGDYRLLTFDVRSRLATLSIEDPGALGVGCVLADRLSAPQTVRAYHVGLSKDAMVVSCWCGGEPGAIDQIARELEAIARKAVGGRLRGRYRYRVTSMVGDRYMLEPVRRDLGLSTLGPLSARPGAAGIWARLAKGTEVVVSFLDDGDPGWPCVEGFAPKGGELFVPEALELCVGPGETAAPVARMGDVVDVFFPPEIPFTGQIEGVGNITGLMTIATNGVGQIASGSERVGSG